MYFVTKKENRTLAFLNCSLIIDYDQDSRG